MNLPNKLTLLRVFLIPVFLVLLYLPFPRHMLLALIVFILASLTDLADGYIARKRSLITTFGKFMDPLADKLLVMAAMLWLVEAGRIPAWCMLLIIAREFAVTALRLVAVEGTRVIAAGWSGKVKTASTMVCLCVMLAMGELIYFSQEFCHSMDVLCITVMVTTTLYSGLEYFIKNRDVLSGPM